MSVEHIPAEDVDMLPCGADWQSRHLESEKEKLKFETESISRQNRARKRQKTTFVRRNRHRRFTTVT